MKYKKIEFIPSSIDTENYFDPPELAKKNIPNWYKNIKNNCTKKPEFVQGNLSNSNVKMCMPFFDAITNGYIQKTWCDIYIQKKENFITFNYSLSDTEIIKFRERLDIQLYNNEFYPFEFIWKVHWTPKTPKNYSVLICHPLNRMDLPFYTLSGIIDSDIYHHSKTGNLPFYIKNNFEGLIPKGTPMYQIIPIKRDNWIKKIVKYNSNVEEKNNLQRSVFWEFYKKNFWQKKVFQ